MMGCQMPSAVARFHAWVPGQQALQKDPAEFVALGTFGKENLDEFTPVGAVPAVCKALVNRFFQVIETSTAIPDRCCPQRAGRTVEGSAEQRTLPRLGEHCSQVGKFGVDRFP